MSSPKIPDIPPPPPPPAKAPDRAEAVAADEIQLGVQDDDTTGTKRGKRGLSRPAPSVGISM